jgi:hypothetical protein
MCNIFVLWHNNLYQCCSEFILKLVCGGTIFGVWLPNFGNFNIPCGIQRCVVVWVHDRTVDMRIRFVCICMFRIYVWVDSCSQSLVLVCTRISRYYIATRYLQSQTRVDACTMWSSCCSYGDELVKSWCHVQKLGIKQASSSSSSNGMSLFNWF